MINQHTEVFLNQDWFNLVSKPNSSLFIELSYKGSKLIAGFELKQFGFLSYLKCPKFTPYNISINHIDDNSNEYSVYAKEVHLINELKQQLKKYNRFQIKCLPTLNIVSPFLDKHTKAYYYTTCFINQSIPIEQCWNNMESATRNHILYGEKNLTIELNGTLEEVKSFITVNSYYHREGLSYELLGLVFNVLKPKGLIKLFIAKKENEIVSISFFIKSRDVWYYWLNINNQEIKSRGSNAVLIWEGIKLAKLQNCHFNFDGSIVPHLEQVFKSFGSKNLAYCNIISNQHLFFKLISKY